MLERKQLDIIDGVDVLMISVGGVYMDTKTVKEVINQISPSVVLPMHYKTKEHNTKIFGKLMTVDEFCRQSGMEVKKADKLVIKSQDLPEETELMVLKRKI